MRKSSMIKESLSCDSVLVATDLDDWFFFLILFKVISIID